MQPKIYLAGPDVFRKNAVSYGKYLKTLCAAWGAEGLWPFDNEVDLKASRAAWIIREANEAMIRRADALVANIDPFRGPNMDPGTAYEIGFARALGKAVYLYTPGLRVPGTLYARTVPGTLHDRTENAILGGADAATYSVVEDFGLIENLMICAFGAGEVYPYPEAAIRAACLAFDKDHSDAA